MHSQQTLPNACRAKGVESEEDISGSIAIDPSCVLSIDTQPTRCKLLHNGSSLGKTPMEFKCIKEGEHHFKISKEHFVDIEKTIVYHRKAKDRRLLLRLSASSDFISYADNLVLVNRNTRVIHDINTQLDWMIGPDKDWEFTAAKKWIASLGHGWRLPTSDEVRSIFRKDRKITRDELKPFSNTGWWVWIADGEELRKASCYCFLPALDRVWHGSKNNANKTRVFAVRSNRLENCDPSAEFMASLPSNQPSQVNQRGQPATLIIRSHTIRARASIDGAIAGHTPLELAFKHEKSFLLRIERKPFLVWQEVVHHVPGSQAVQLEVKMELPSQYSFDQSRRWVMHHPSGGFEDLETGFFWLPYRKMKAVSFYEGKQWLDSLGNGWELPTMTDLLGLHGLMEHNADFDYIEQIWRTDYIWSSETTGGNDCSQGDSFKIRCLLRDHYSCLEG